LYSTERPEVQGFVLTADEHRAILKERLAVLDAATAQTTLDGPLPVRWRHGWSCGFRILRRDPDGSLLVAYAAEGPNLQGFYVRKRRFVRQADLDRKLRERVARD